jgi:curli biogenesis system outer membrane secretion channel CsgG
VKRLGRVVACLLFACLAAGAQEKKEEQKPTLGPPPATSQDQKKQQRPTLGPSSEESLGGPSSAVTSDPARLAHTRKIYIENIDNRLSDKLLTGLGKSGRFRIVAERNEADAILRGTCFDSRRLKTLHSEVYLNDRVTGKSIWQDSVRVPYNPPSLAKAVDRTADEILKHLAASTVRAQP